MDPVVVVVALDLAKAGAILADMVESFLAAGATSQLLEGADQHDDDVKDRRTAPVAGGVLGGMCAVYGLREAVSGRRDSGRSTGQGL